MQSRASPGQRRAQRRRTRRAWRSYPTVDELAQLFAALETEGSASLVGDVAAMPEGIDAASDEERKKVRRNIGMVGRSITLLELSVHGFNTGAQVGYDNIYELGFYGDEVLYALGYVMARAIAAEEGKNAIAGADRTARRAVRAALPQPQRLWQIGDRAGALSGDIAIAADRLAACMTNQ